MTRRFGNNAVQSTEPSGGARCAADAAATFFPRHFYFLSPCALLPRIATVSFINQTHLNVETALVQLFRIANLL